MEPMVFVGLPPASVRVKILKDRGIALPSQELIDAFKVMSTNMSGANLKPVAQHVLHAGRDADQALLRTAVEKTCHAAMGSSPVSRDPS